MALVNKPILLFLKMAKGNKEKAIFIVLFKKFLIPPIKPICFCESCNCKIFFLNFFNQENIGFNLEGLNGSYMNNFGEECIIHFYLDPNWNHEQCISFLRNQNMVLVDQMKDQINNISKITLFSKNRDLILRWKEELKDRYKITIFDVKNSDLLYCELTYRTISKASAVDIMLKELNADLKDTIAFGDSMNDYEILQHCQLGIAMGNAVQQLKDVADDITDSVTNNGIYNSFIKYHLIEPK